MGQPVTLETAQSGWSVQLVNRWLGFESLRERRPSQGEPSLT
jgi:hypothetical protein